MVNEDTSEVRVTSSTGGQKGSKPARYDLMPTEPLRLLAEHYGKGAAKYARVNGVDNWRNGYEWSLSYAALMRHLQAFWSGEDIDAETGSPHMVAVAWHAFTLLEFMREHPTLDDRQDPLYRREPASLSGLLAESRGIGGKWARAGMVDPKQGGAYLTRDEC